MSLDISSPILTPDVSRMCNFHKFTILKITLKRCFGFFVVMYNEYTEKYIQYMG